MFIFKMKAIFWPNFIKILLRIHKEKTDGQSYFALKLSCIIYIFLKSCNSSPQPVSIVSSDNTQCGLQFKQQGTSHYNDVKQCKSYKFKLLISMSFCLYWFLIYTWTNKLHRKRV